MFRVWMCVAAGAMMSFGWPEFAAGQEQCDPRLFGHWAEGRADTTNYIVYTFNADGTYQESYGGWEVHATGTVRDTVESWKAIAYKCIRPDAFMLYWKNGQKCLVLIDFSPGEMASAKFVHEGDMIRGGGYDCANARSAVLQRTN